MTKVSEIFKEINSKNIVNKNMKPSEFVSKAYSYYLKTYGSNNSLNGSVFEEIVIRVLLNNEIKPVYAQCKMSFVPNVIFDIVLYNEKMPISLSLKTSIRERWKQADLEAVALKYIYRNAKCFLVSNSTNEIAVRKREENSYLGLDSFVDINSSEFDELVEYLKTMDYEENKSIPVFTSFKEYK